jgi:hypothetical protein
MADEFVPTAVLIETSRHHIVGNVSVPAVDRLSDYANDPGRHFWAITDAQIAPLDDPDRLRGVDFVLVARHEITMIRPGWTAQKHLDDPLEDVRASFMTPEY